MTFFAQQILVCDSQLLLFCCANAASKIALKHLGGPVIWFSHRALRRIPGQSGNEIFAAAKGREASKVEDMSGFLTTWKVRRVDDDVW
jgi:hypothetical protein